MMNNSGGALLTEVYGSDTIKVKKKDKRPPIRPILATVQIGIFFLIFSSKKSMRVDIGIAKFPISNVPKSPHYFGLASTKRRIQ